jgi:uncharacterized protein
MSFRTARLAAALALGAMLAFGAAAQTKKELAAKVLQLQQSGVENVGRAVAGQVAQRVMQMAGQGLQRVSADKRETVGREIQADVKKFYDDVEPVLRKRAIELAPSVVGTTYEERFSEDELKQIIAWLEAPVSKRFSQIDGELGNAMVAKLVADSRPTVEPRLAALEQSIAKKLGMKPGSAASAPAAPAASKKP